jgi:hypothetical protein
MRRIVAVLAVSAVALAACGGSSSKSGSDSNGNKNDAFSQLYDKRKNATIKVTYENHDSDGTTGDSFTVAQDGPDKTAYTSGSSKTIVNGDTVTECSNMDTTPDCQVLPGGANAAQAMIAGLTGVLSLADGTISAAAAAGGYGDTSSETIAGRDADCVKITIGSALGKLGSLGDKLGKLDKNAGYQTCVDKETGVLLKWAVQGNDNDKSELIATKVEQPTDADFEAPAGSIETTVPDSTDSTDTTGGDGSTPTTACTPVTLPGGGTIPGVPCMPA